MPKKSPPAKTPARRCIEAIDELFDYVRARYWETDREHYMDNNELKHLAELEGRVVGLLTQFADGKIAVPKNHPNNESKEKNIWYTPLTGIKGFFVGPGANLDCDDHWEPKMLGVRAAVQATLGEEIGGKKPSVKRSEVIEERDKWIYDLCCQESPVVTYTNISRRLVKIKKWPPIESKQGILEAAKRYAKRHGFKAPPSRQFS